MASFEIVYIGGNGVILNETRKTVSCDRKEDAVKIGVQAAKEFVRAFGDNNGYVQVYSVTQEGGRKELKQIPLNKKGVYSLENIRWTGVEVEVDQHLDGFGGD